MRWDVSSPRATRASAPQVWRLPPGDLELPQPPVVLGHGSFGQVLKGYYRGAPVAVKRVIPTDPRKAEPETTRAPPSHQRPRQRTLAQQFTFSEKTAIGLGPTEGGASGTLAGLPHVVEVQAPRRSINRATDMTLIDLDDNMGGLAKRECNLSGPVSRKQVWRCVFGVAGLLWVSPS